MEANKRIIVAVDVSDVHKAVGIVRSLGDHVGGFKIGFELIYTMLAQLVDPVAYNSARAHAAILHLFELVAGKCFLDVKLKDIPNTVAGAAKAIARLKPLMFNLHCDGGPDMMRGAVEALRSVNSEAKILGVTVLTSLKHRDLVQMGLLPRLNESAGLEALASAEQTCIEALVVNFAKLAQEAGLQGVIASAQEAALIREACGDGYIIGTPGIRPLWAAVGDQRRITTPKDAVKAGADFLVIGRPITAYLADKGGPVEAVRLIAAEIEQALAEKPVQAS